MIDLILWLLVPALKAIDGKSRNPWHWLAAAIVLPIDVIVAHTTWRTLGGAPQTGEWTISQMLERLCVTAGERQKLFIQLALEINRRSPTGAHIKSVIGLSA